MNGIPKVPRGKRGNLTAQQAALKKEEKREKKLEAKVNKLVKSEMPSLHKFIKEGTPDLIKIIMAKGEAAESLDALFAKTMGVADYPIKRAAKYGARTAGHVAPLTKPDPTAGKFALGVDTIQLMLRLPARVGEGGLLICKQMIIKEMKKQLKKLKKQQAKNPSDELNKQITKVEEWVKEKEAQHTRQSVAFAIKVAGYLPRAAKTVAALTTKVGARAGYAFTWALMGASTIVDAIDVHYKSQAVKKQKAWIKRFAETPGGTDKAKAHLKKREAVHIAKILSKLKEKGKAPKKEPQNLKELRTYLTAHKLESVELEVHKAETIATSTRKGIKALALRKQKTERAMQKYQLGAAKAKLSISSIFFAIILTIKGLALGAIIAIAAATLVASILGVALIAIGIIILTIGAIYFNHRKPNEFKEYSKLVHAKLALLKIPEAKNRHSLAKRRLKRLEKTFAYEREDKKLKKMRQLQRTGKGDKKLEARIHKSEEKLGKLERQYNENNKAIVRIEKRLAKWQKKVAEKQKIIDEARWKDFVQKAKLERTVKGEPIAMDEVIAKGQLLDEETLDKASATLLQEQLGIDLASLKKSENAEEEVKKALREFFSMSDTALIRFISKQQAA